MTTQARNEAAERLLDWVDGDAEKRSNFRFRVDEALTAERRATVERIRERIEVWLGKERAAFPAAAGEALYLLAILDEEAAR